VIAGAALVNGVERPSTVWIDLSGNPRCATAEHWVYVKEVPSLRDHVGAMQIAERVRAEGQDRAGPATVGNDEGDMISGPIERAQHAAGCGDGGGGYVHVGVNGLAAPQWVEGNVAWVASALAMASRIALLIFLRVQREPQLHLSAQVRVERYPWILGHRKLLPQMHLKRRGLPEIQCARKFR